VRFRDGSWGTRAVAPAAAAPAGRAMAVAAASSTESAMVAGASKES
jgi:hypothetical protein